MTCIKVALASFALAGGLLSIGNATAFATQVTQPPAQEVTQDASGDEPVAMWQYAGYDNSGASLYQMQVYGPVGPSDLDRLSDYTGLSCADSGQDHVAVCK